MSQRPQASDREEVAHLDNAWFVEFPTEPPGVLRLAPGSVKVSYRFSIGEGNADGWAADVECTLRLADADGRLWQAVSRMPSYWLLYPLIDLSRKQPARYLDSGPVAWREALTERPLLQNVPATYDDRFYRYVWLDNMAVSLDFHYLGAAFDVAALDGGRLVVAVKDLFCCWNPVRLENARGAPLAVPKPSGEPAEEEEGGDYEHMPAVAYEIDVGRVIFHNTARRNDDDMPWIDTPLFRPVAGRSEPQPRVTHCQLARLTAPTVLPGIVQEQEAIPLLIQERLEFLIDAGGKLHVEGSSGFVEMSLGRHPGCVGEAVDVLCCRLRLPDDAGDLWEGVSLFTPEVFLEKLVDLDRIDGSEFAENAEAEWREALDRSPLLRGVRGVLDDGGWRYLQLGDEVVAFHGRGQKFTVELALSKDRDRVIVSVTGLIGRRRPVETDHESRYVVLDPPDRAAEHTSWKRDQPLPPLIYPLSPWDLAQRNTTFAVDDGFWHNNPVPIPVVFRRVGKATPVPWAHFVPDGT
jgi:hypothetical protein